MQPTNKILIIAPAWIGDMVMAQVLFKLIKQQQSDCEIHVLAPAWTLALTKFMPEVCKTITAPFKHGKLALITRHQLGKNLRTEKYQQAIVLPNSLKSTLLPLFAKIPKRTGWLGEMRFFLLNDWRKLDKDKLPMMIERFAALGLDNKQQLPEKLPYPCFEVDRERALSELLTFAPVVNSEKILAICPGAEYGPAKRWSAEYFAEVAQRKLDENWHVWIFGSNNDQEAADKIQLLTQNRCLNLAGKTTLEQAVKFLALTDAVICNDSGLMHIAAALVKKLVVIYGSSSPQFTPPLSKKAQILSLNLPCSPCFKRECPYGHYNCLRNLTPDAVLALI